MLIRPVADVGADATVNAAPTPLETAWPEP
jgi:hypothetical protein